MDPIPHSTNETQEDPISTNEKQTPTIGNDSVLSIERVMRQTEYTADQAKQKLELHQWNETNVIREYLGIPPVVVPTLSINQSIYKQLRTRLDANMRDYRERGNGKLS